MSHCIIGAVSRVGRKGVMKVFKLGRKSPWVLTPARPFPNGQANVGSWSATKNALYYCALLAQTASPEFFYIVFVDDGCCLAQSCPVHSPWLFVQGKLSFVTLMTRNEGNTDNSFAKSQNFIFKVCSRWTLLTKLAKWWEDKTTSYWQTCDPLLKKCYGDALLLL